MKKLIVILLFMASVFGCQRDEFENETVNLPLGIDWAKTWFEINYHAKINLKSGSVSGEDKNLNPDWKSAVKSANEKYEVVSVNLLTDREFGFTTDEAKKAWVETNEIRYIQSVSRLIILKNKTTLKTNSFIMTIIGDKYYLEKKKFNLSENNSYLKKDSDFSGIIFYHGMDGRFVNGWKFTDGKVTHTVNLPADVEMGIPLKSASVCTTEDITEWVLVPRYSSYAGMPGSEQYQGTTYDIYTFTYTITTCYEVGGNTGTSGASGTSGGDDGDVPGGYDPPEENPCNCTNYCPDCGGCLDGNLKSTGNPSGQSSGSGTTTPCPACSCPKSFSAENALGVDMTGPAEAPDDPQKIAAIRGFLAGTEKTITDNDGKVYFWYNGYLCCYYNGQWYGEYDDNKWESFVPKEYVFSVRDKIESLLGKTIANIAVFASRYVLPFEDAYIVWTGVDFNGIQSNTQVAAAFLLLEIVPGNDIFKGYKPVARVVAGTEMIIKYDGKAWKAVFKEFTESNYRHNLEQLTGGVQSSDMQAHHVFPKATEFLPNWERVGLNIHEPWYMQWWPSPFHQQNWYAYNQEWSRFFFENQNATLEQILQKGRELMEKYGFTVYY